MKTIPSKAVVFFSLIFPILIFSIFSCQKAKDSQQLEGKKLQVKKGQYHGYLVDSLRAADQLELFANKVIEILGQPHGADKFSKSPVYDEYHIRLYQDRLAALNVNREIINEIQKFLEKYRGKPESEFYSYSATADIVQKLRVVDKYQKRMEVKNYRERRDGSECYMLGLYLGEFVYDTFSLISHKEDFWIATSQDLTRMEEEARKKLEKAKRKLELLEDERARSLEEKLTGKK